MIKISEEKNKMIYEPESGILSWEMNKKTIVHAKKIKSVIIHFTKNNIPVLIEILEPNSLLMQLLTLTRKEKIAETIESAPI